MGKLTRRGIGLLLAFIVTYFLAVSFHTLMVLRELQHLGVEMSFPIVMQSLRHDWGGMLTTYGMLIFVVLLVAFMGMSYLRRHINLWGIPLGRNIFPWSGAVALMLALLLMYPFLHITLIAGARGLLGMLLQGLAGFIGGLVYQHSVQWLRGRARHKARHRQQRNHRRI